MKGKNAFSILELVVVLAIVVVLSALMFSGLRSGRQAADRATAVSQMRQIGLAVFAYASDHDNTVPGPLLVGAATEYNPGKTTEMATALGPYLGVDDLARKKVLPVFLPPACVRGLPGTSANSIRPYVMNMSMQIDGEATSPWGSTTDSKPPVKLGTVSTATWAFVDADRENPLVTGQPWSNCTPAKAVHGRNRLGWFFNGSVQGVEASALAVAKAKPPRK